MYFETTQMVNRGTKECTTADVAVHKKTCVKWVALAKCSLWNNNIALVNSAIVFSIQLMA